MVEPLKVLELRLQDANLGEGFNTATQGKLQRYSQTAEGKLMTTRKVEVKRLEEARAKHLAITAMYHKFFRQRKEFQAKVLNDLPKWIAGDERLSGVAAYSRRFVYSRLKAGLTKSVRVKAATRYFTLLQASLQQSGGVRRGAFCSTAVERLALPAIAKALACKGIRTVPRGGDRTRERFCKEYRARLAQERKMKGDIRDITVDAPLGVNAIDIAELCEFEDDPPEFIERYVQSLPEIKQERFRLAVYYQLEMIMLEAIE